MMSKVVVTRVIRSSMWWTCVFAFIAVVPRIVSAEIPAVGVVNFGANDSGSATASCLRMVGALFFCLGVFAGGVHLYRKFVHKVGTASKRRMIVRERLSLSSKSALILVSLDGKEFVVASGSEHVTLVPTNTIMAASFSESLEDETTREEVFNA
jgi:flagellar biogenesis protein FliO